MGLFGKFGLGQKSVGSTQNRFMKVLDEVDLSQAVDTKCAFKSQWYKVGGGYTVSAQQMLHVGYGSPDLPDNQGYLYIQLTDIAGAGNPFYGKVRIVQANAQETTKFVVAEYNLASTHGSVTNKAMMIALPEQTQFPMVGEDSKVWLEVKNDADTKEVDISLSEVYIPVTIYM